MDEAFVDMTGCEALSGEPREMGEAVRRAVFRATQLAVSVGVSTTKYVAKVASDRGKPDGLTVVAPDEVTGFLHPLSIDRLWGVGPRTRERLEAHGIATIGDVAATPLATLERWLGGSLGAHVHALAHGRDSRAVVPSARRRVSARRTPSTRTSSGKPRGAPPRVLPPRADSARGSRRLRAGGTRRGAKRSSSTSSRPPRTVHDERLDRTLDAVRKRFGEQALTRARNLDRNRDSGPRT